MLDIVSIHRGGLVFAFTDNVVCSLGIKAEDVDFVVCIPPSADLGQCNGECSASVQGSKILGADVLKGGGDEAAQLRLDDCFPDDRAASLFELTEIGEDKGVVEPEELILEAIEAALASLFCDGHFPV